MATTKQYPGTVKLVTFTIAEGDPTGGTIVATVRDPNGAKTTYTYGDDAELTKMATGVYQLRVPCALNGTWSARLVLAGGSLEGADEFTWWIASSAFS